MTAPTVPATGRDYRLGPVLPHVKRAAQIVGDGFGLTSILGWRATAVDMTGHPAGRALDFMCTSQQGDGIAAFLLGNADALALEHLIWKQRYREPGGDWEPMEDRGSPTQNHMDHVHGKFRVLPGSGLINMGQLSGGDGLDLGLGAGDWAGDALSIAVKLAATIAAGALLVVGINRTLTTKES